MSGSTEDWDRWHARKDAVTRNHDEAFVVTAGGPSSEFDKLRERVTGNGCSCCESCDLERRIKVRMAEAENAARLALARVRQLSARSDPDSIEIGRLAQVARMHDVLAEALGDVLNGGF